jgi:hypothetical protein
VGKANDVLSFFLHFDCSALCGGPTPRRTLQRPNFSLNLVMCCAVAAELARARPSLPFAFPVPCSLFRFTVAACAVPRNATATHF